MNILEIDPWLAPFKDDLELRMKRYRQVKNALLGKKGSFKDFANGHHYFGFHRADEGWWYREWAPAADALFLTGDFNHWDRTSHKLKPVGHGAWEIFIPSENAPPHGSLVKVHVVYNDKGLDRIPLYSRRVVQNPKTRDFAAQIWAPGQEYKWKNGDYRRDPSNPLFIYETHIGMAQETEAVGTYKEFEEQVLPRVKELGYNAIQVMALMEHPYYGSFGYHVSNYFAASSWFGTPDELKSLIDKAHGMGISVIMDLVHSHAVKNKSEGINEFDGTDYQFFHSGLKGTHKEWDSKLFDYGKHEVIHFLLSNIKFWMEEYHIDGFRFDGVTSMLYHDHGLGTNFDEYGKYFSPNTDTDAVVYLQFANELIKEIRKDAVTIAEDMSGMPGMALPVKDGGIGFDYRLAMGMPDFWVKTLQTKDSDWDMFRMWHELSTSRPDEKRIAYVESHDQALVGDKTVMFRLADKEMYGYMEKNSQNIVIDRAVSLHKMIRLITISLGSEGYLNFMGNEFGHPEWIDFPREENGWSFHYSRRQWSLVDSTSLRYEDLNVFDKGMIHFMGEHSLMGVAPESLWIDQERKIVAYRKNGFIFIFNFHPVMSFERLEIPTHDNGNYVVVMDTDEGKYGGFDRISHDMTYGARRLTMNKDLNGITVYSPSRTAMVLRKVTRRGVVIKPGSI